MSDEPAGIDIVAYSSIELIGLLTTYCKQLLRKAYVFVHYIRPTQKLSKRSLKVKLLLQTTLNLMISTEPIQRIK